MVAKISLSLNLVHYQSFEELLSFFRGYLATGPVSVKELFTAAEDDIMAFVVSNEISSIAVSHDDVLLLPLHTPANFGSLCHTT